MSSKMRVRELMALTIVLVVTLTALAGTQQPGRLIPATPAQTPSPQASPTPSPQTENRQTPTEPAQTPSPEPQSTPEEQQPTPVQPAPTPAEPQATPSPEVARPRRATSEQPASTEQVAPGLWHDPGDISSLDLYQGPGGEGMKPDLSSVTFIQEETGGYSTKYRVRDGSGNIWVAKVGNEAQPETVATRLVSAVGYYTDITYLVPSIEIKGKGTFKNVRLEARPKSVKRLTEWKWESNPFVGTRELQGLKVLMAFVNNWDLKNANNRILSVHNEETGRDELRYIVSDLGATFGKTGGAITRSRNKPQDYAKSKFISGVKNNMVEFNYHGKSGELLSNISVEQARWIGDMLSRLSDRQIADAIRAANYGPEDAQMLLTSIKARITELKNLPA